MTFIDKLKNAWNHSNSLVCVGLDPDLNRIPTHLHNTENTIFEFNKAIIDATHDLVCAYKPQIAYFASAKAENQLQQTMDYLAATYPHIPVILDAKRGDIGPTAKQYAIEAFERFRADAVTLNPYLGIDSIEPFFDYPDKGCVLLCRTSNASASNIQDLEVNGEPLYQKIAAMIANDWNKHNNCLLVVGATWPQQMREVREIVGDMPLLVPGVGAQGGDVEAMVKAGKTADDTGLVISSSRGIIYASEGEDFADTARTATLELRDKINQYR